MGLPGGSVGKESACNTGDKGDVGLISGREDLLEGMAINSSILAQRPMDRGAWQATVHGVTK